MTAQQTQCSKCGATMAPLKNYTRLSIWRRELPRKCQSCKSTTHGLSRSRLYKIWMAMLGRCGQRAVTNPMAFLYYINKGIKVCEDWNDFPTFAAWALSNGYEDNLTIDRIDSGKGYEPGNCRWVTMAENLRSRDDRKLSHQDADEIRRLRACGVKAAEIADRYGITRNHVYRIAAGGRWA